MPSEMKVIMESWDKFVLNEQQDDNWVTWRMLQDAIELVKAEKQGEETAERQKKLLTLAGKSGFKLLLGFLGPVGAMIDVATESVETISDMVKAYSKADDSKTKNNPFLDLFNLDDGFEDLIDDNLEDQFVEKMIGDIPDHIAKHPDQVIPDFDQVVQAWLPTLNLSGTTNNNVTKNNES
jgi:hypothetical protein